MTDNDSKSNLSYLNKLVDQYNITNIQYNITVKLSLGYIKSKI